LVALDEPMIGTGRLQIVDVQMLSIFDASSSFTFSGVKPI
jgi:hypothetical protein